MKNRLNDIDINEKDIKNIFEKIETPEYNAVEEIMRRINSEQGQPEVKTKAGLKHKILVIAMAVVVMSTLISAAYKVYEADIMDFLGNITGTAQNYLVFKGTETRSEEQIAFETEFLIRKDGQIPLITLMDDKGNYAGSQIADMRYSINSLEEMKSHMNGTVFEFPEYIPTDYEFESAYVEFYFDDADILNSKLIHSEEKYGNVYEIYAFDEINALNEKKIFTVSIQYKNSEADVLWYYGNIVDTKLSRILIIENMETETLAIPGYDGSVLSSYSWRENDKDFTQLQLHLMKAGISPIQTRNLTNFNREHREKILQENIKELYGMANDGVAYTISSESLDRTELIKIAENLE